MPGGAGGDCLQRIGSWNQAMQLKPERQITLDIDTLLATVGAIAGLELTLWLAISTTNRYYPLFTFLSCAACATYLVLKRRSVFASVSEPPTEHARSRSIPLLLLSISFFVLMSYAFLSVVMRSDQYSRPVAYFVATALAGAVLAAEIVLLPSEEGYAYFVLAKIILLVIGFIWSIMVLFPGVIGFDAFYHGPFTETILENRNIPTGEYYSTFAGMHLTVGSTMLVADLDYKTACMLSACLVYVVVILSFVFLLGRSIGGSRVGLLAALLVGCSPPYLRWGWGMAPNGYAMVFLISSIYLITKCGLRHPVRLLALSMLLMAVLILTHSMAPLCMAIFLFVALLGQIFYKRVYQESFKASVTLSLLVLFSIAMCAWWMQGAEKPIETLRDLIRTSFSASNWTQPLSQSRDYMQSIPFTEYVIRVIMDPVFWALGFIGCLALFSRRFGNRHGFNLAASGLAVLAIGIISMPLGIGVLPDRWQLASVYLLAVPAGIGLLAISSVLRRTTVRALCLAFIVGALVFICIVCPLADIDRPITTPNTTVRYGFKESELRAADTITDAWGTNVAADGYYLEVLPANGAILRNLNTNFVTMDFTDREDRVVIIRQEVVERPFYLPEVYRLDYDPREILEQQGFSQIYDCGTVTAFAYPAE